MIKCHGSKCIIDILQALDIIYFISSFRLHININCVNPNFRRGDRKIHISNSKCKINRNIMGFFKGGLFSKPWKNLVFINHANAIVFQRTKEICCCCIQASHFDINCNSMHQCFSNNIALSTVLNLNIAQKCGNIRQPFCLEVSINRTGNWFKFLGTKRDKYRFTDCVLFLLISLQCYAIDGILHPKN